MSFQERTTDTADIRPNLNFLNYSIFTFGLYNSDTDGIAAYVDTDKFANGFHLNDDDEGQQTATPFSNNDGTKFRMIPKTNYCLLYTSPSPRDRTRSRMPSSA